MRFADVPATVYLKIHSYLARFFSDNGAWVFLFVSTGFLGAVSTWLKVKFGRFKRLLSVLTYIGFIWMFIWVFNLHLFALVIAYFLGSFLTLIERMGGSEWDFRASKVKMKASKPFNLVLQFYTTVLSVFESFFTYSLDLVYFSFVFGFVGPLSAVFSIKFRDNRYLRFFSFLGMLAGLPVGFLWLFRVGWLIGLVLYVPFSFYTCWLRVSRRRVEFKPVSLRVDGFTVRGRFLSYDGFAWVLLAVQFVMIVLMLRDYPLGVDSAYHTLIGKLYAERGLILWDDVEFAPVGRPHLYPPFFHVMVAVLGRFLGGSGWSFVRANVVVSAFTYLLGLYVTWRVSRGLTGSYGGLASLILVSGSFISALVMAVGLPSALVFVLTPLALKLYSEGRVFEAYLVSLCTVYSHMSGLPFILISFLMFGLLKGRIRDALMFSLIVLISYLPWLLRIIYFVGWFRVIEHDIATHFDLALIALAIPGLLISLKDRRRYALILAYLSCFSIVAVTYPGRAAIQSNVVLALLGGVTFSKVGLKLRKYRNKILALLFLFMYTYPLMPSSILMELNIIHENSFNQIPLREAENISRFIVLNYGPGTIINTNDPVLGCAMAVFEPLRITIGMWVEVRPKEVESLKLESRLLLVHGSPGVEGEPSGDLFKVVYRHGGYTLFELTPENFTINRSKVFYYIELHALKAADNLYKDRVESANQILALSMDIIPEK